jgi:methionyl-tRNA formyltransferase
MRVVFFGTPEFAVPALEAVAARFDVALVIAQPDRPKGRGRALAAPPVKTAALALGIPVLQVESPNVPSPLYALRAIRPDLFVVVAYGAILSSELLLVPKLGAINLHGSILPRYRGASPIQAALLDGLPETGATTMWMDEGLDTGDMIATRTLPIGPEETAGELSARLATMGAALLADTLAQVEAGSASRTPQPSEGATVTKKIRKDDGRLDFTQPAQRVHDRARAMTPWPGALASFAGETLRFARTRIAEGTGAPGAVLSTAPLIVACGEGALEVVRVVPAGKAEMDAPDWWRGLRASKDETRFTTPHREELS